MYQGRRRPLATVCLLLLTIAVVAGCTNAPPPPVVRSTSPAPTSTVPTKPPKPRVVVAGVGELRRGLNPHAVADQSAATSALSALMLPSVFVPGPNGEPRLNTTLMESAEVVPDTEKFTVRYRIRTDAGWSDGAPIAAEDFVYLWQQMRSQPGVVNPAGYRMISDVTASQGGKTVRVTFRQPYPQWKSLFDHLLPAHLVKDAPGGWADALDDGYPASGGPFAIRSVDFALGEVVLMRNERYWGPAAKSERIVLRSNDQAGHIAALRSGDALMAMFDADAATMDALRGLGDDVRLMTVPRPVTTQLLLRPGSPELSDVRVRRAVLAALDRRKLVEVGTGGGPAQQLRSHAQVLAPSEPGYRPTEPPGAISDRAEPQRVANLLTEAGYTRRGEQWVRDGEPLNLAIAAQFHNDQYVHIAEELATQLREQGIRATVVTPKGDELFRDTLATDPMSQQNPAEPGVDVAVVPRAAGGSPAATLASNWGCPRATSAGGQAYPHNMAGFCDRMLQPTIAAALTGEMPFAAASGTVEPVLWSRAVAVPLYQQAQVLAVRRELSGVRVGHGFAGPFAGAGKWVGTPGESYDW